MSSSNGTEPNRRRLIDRARTLYPDAWARVRGSCLFVADDVDVDLHAARIVLAAHGGKH